MALESQTRTIGGIDYEVWRMPNLKAAKLLVRIGKFMGPAIGAIPRTAWEAKQAGATDELGTDLLTSPVAALLDALTEEQLESIARDLLYKAKIGTKPLSADAIDIDIPNAIDLFKVIWFALEVNFASFLGGWSLDSLGPLMKVLQETKNGPS